MQDTTTTIYCLCDDFLKAIEHRDDPQTNFTTAQVMAIPLVASCFFSGMSIAPVCFCSKQAISPSH